MHPINLDHCVIHVSDWERSTTFYRDVLGAELVKVGSGWSYRFGETQFNCHGPDVHGTPVAGLPVMPGGSDLCFIWPGSFQTAIAHLEEHGIPVEEEPVSRFGSRGQGTSVYFRDPDGSLMNSSRTKATSLADRKPSHRLRINNFRLITNG